MKALSANRSAGSRSRSLLGGGDLLDRDPPASYDSGRQSRNTTPGPYRSGRHFDRSRRRRATQGRMLHSTTEPRTLPHHRWVNRRGARVLWILLLAGSATLAPCREARADWLITPWVATTFAIDTTYLTLETGARARRYAMFGVSGTWLGSHVFGVEGEFAAAPSFFEVEEIGNPLDSLLLDSHLVTLFGNVIVATPLSVSGDSLRPYLLGGLGWIWATMEDQIRLVDSDDALGLQLGGGAIGFLTRRVALRFDLRNIRTLSRGTSVRGARDWKLNYWRAGIGVTIRGRFDAGP